MFSQACVENSVRGGGVACVTGETATAADGTHPTGMHSSSSLCVGTEYLYFLNPIKNIFRLMKEKWMF